MDYTKKGYKCLDPTTNKTYITMDVTFLESEPFFSPMLSNSALQGESMNKELNWYLAAPSSIVEMKQIGEHESEVEGVIYDEPIEMQHLNIIEVKSEEDPSTNEGIASEKISVNEDYIDQVKIPLSP